MLCAKAGRIFMQTGSSGRCVPCLNSVPVTPVTDSELIKRPSIPVTKHSLSQKDAAGTN